MNRDVLDRLKRNPKARAVTREPPTHPRRYHTFLHRSFLLPLFFMMGFVLLAVVAWSGINNPALASILSIAAITPTQASRQFWARAELPKPTFVPTAIPPTPINPIAPAPSPTQPPPVILANLVADTPDPDAGETYEDPAQAAPEVSYTGSKYILVDISEQHLYAYENDGLLYSFVVSTGMNNATAVGNFAVQSKIENAYGSTWDIWMPNWLGIYWSGGLENGIHALPILSNGGILWEGFLGRPISYGCVVLGTYESQLLFDWAEYGTPVDIQW
jgi:lipoprotein-anchoring transpeptidase ErfK/SrfK